MKNWFKTIAIAAALASGATTITQAQQERGERGQRPDPEEMRQRMAERMREQFAVTDDAEWKVIEGKIQKVTEARRAAGGGGFGAMAFGGGGRGGARGGQGGAEAGGGGRGGGRAFGGFGEEPSAEV